MGYLNAEPGSNYDDQNKVFSDLVSTINLKLTQVLTVLLYREWKCSTMLSLAIMHAFSPMVRLGQERVTPSSDMVKTRESSPVLVLKSSNVSMSFRKKTQALIRELSARSPCPCLKSTTRESKICSPRLLNVPRRV